MLVGDVMREDASHSLRPSSQQETWAPRRKQSPSEHVREERGWSRCYSARIWTCPWRNWQLWTDQISQRWGKIGEIKWGIMPKQWDYGWIWPLAASLGDLGWSYEDNQQACRCHWTCHHPLDWTCPCLHHYSAGHREREESYRSRKTQEKKRIARKNLRKTWQTKGLWGGAEPGNLLAEEKAETLLIDSFSCPGSFKVLTWHHFS